MAELNNATIEKMPHEMHIYLYYFLLFARTYFDQHIGFVSELNLGCVWFIKCFFYQAQLFSKFSVGSCAYFCMIKG